MDKGRMEKIEMDTHASVKGQIVIPAVLRRKYGIKKGTKIIVSDTGD
jgi:AbrB family looped-hinge helix DNA binding protein